MAAAPNLPTHSTRGRSHDSDLTASVPFSTTFAGGKKASRCFLAQRQQAAAGETKARAAKASRKSQPGASLALLSKPATSAGFFPAAKPPTLGTPSEPHSQKKEIIGVLRHVSIHITSRSKISGEGGDQESGEATPPLESLRDGNEVPSRVLLLLKIPRVCFSKTGQEPWRVFSNLARTNEGARTHTPPRAPVDPGGNRED